MKRTAAFVVVFLALQAANALPAGWREIRPGGETACARGGTYKFLVRAGDPQKIVVSFAGGGACWDDFTCDSDRIYTDTAEKTYGPVNNEAGIFNFSNKNNPYKGWTHLYIPYCTGDVHLGNADTTYTRPDQSRFTIRHRGGINARAALAWLENNYKNATEINVDGCSAGSYGSVLWTPLISEKYPQAKLLQFGDSGAGVSDSLFIPQWGVEKSLPHWISALDPARVELEKLSIVDIYREIANHYPRARFSQFNHDQDRVQILYYAAMGGNGTDWTPRMFKNMNESSVSAPNFRYYVAAGKAHCAISNANFYGITSDGVNLSQWLSRAISGQDSQNVICQECMSRVR